MTASAAKDAASATIRLGSTPTRVVVSADGARVYVLATDTTGAGTVSVIDAATFTTIGAPINVGAKPAGMAVSPDGSRLYVSNGTDSTVSVIDTATNTTIGAPINVGINPAGVAVSQDGSRVYVTGGEPAFGIATLSVIDTSTNKMIGAPIMIGEYNEFGGDGAVAVSPDGAHVYVTGYVLGGKDSDTVRPFISSVMVINAATNTVSDRISVGSSNPTSVAVSPDGTRVYVTGSAGLGTGSVRVIDTATNTTIGTAITVGYDFTSSVAVSPDGARVYVTGLNVVAVPTVVTVIDTATRFVNGAPIQVGIDAALGAAVSPDGKRIYVIRANPVTYAGAVSMIDTAILDPNSDSEKQVESFYRKTGWIPVWGSLMSAVSLVVDLGEFVNAVANRNAADIADEVGDLFGDVLGIGLGLLPWGAGVATAAGDSLTRLVGPTV